MPDVYTELDVLMRNFSFVFQSVYLFQDTIANNIRFDQPDAPMEKVIETEKSSASLSPVP